MSAEPIIGFVEPKEVGDRQLDALLGRLDALTDELRGLNRRLDAGDNLAPVVHELRAVRESLEALAYAALGQQGPQVRRRRSG
jgi:DNA-binding FrmR family transcriptional regulator